MQTLGIANLGDGSTSGGGILLWEATWIPVTDTNTPRGLDSPLCVARQPEPRDQDGETPFRPHTALTGSDDLENENGCSAASIAANLGRGVHEGTLPAAAPASATRFLSG